MLIVVQNNHGYAIPAFQNRRELSMGTGEEVRSEKLEVRSAMSFLLLVEDSDVIDLWEVDFYFFSELFSEVA